METVKLERRQGPRKAQYYTLTTSTEIEHTTSVYIQSEINYAAFKGAVSYVKYDPLIV